MIKKRLYKNLAIALGLLLVLEAPTSTLATTNNSKILIANNDISTVTTTKSVPQHKTFTEFNGQRIEGIVSPKDFNYKASHNASIKDKFNSLTNYGKKQSNLNTNFKKGQKTNSTLKTGNTKIDANKAITKKEEIATASKKIKPLVEPQFTQDELIIKYKPGVNLLTKSNLYSSNNLKIKKYSATSKLDLITTPKGANLDTLIKKIKLNPNVEYVQKNYHYTTSSVSNDPMIDKLWGMDNNGQTINNSIGVKDMDIDAPEAWAITKGSSNVVVGVIDTGIDINHTDIKNNIWVNTGEIPGDGIDNDKNGYVDDVNGWDFYNDDNTVFDAADGDQHGTHVAGTIAASINNSNGVAGVAPLTKIMPLKFIGAMGGDTFNAIRALEYAKAKGVKITSNSWGGGGYDTALENAIRDFGGLFVAAAGNESNDNDAMTTYPSGFDLDNILSVAAVDNKGDIAYFSNYGKNSVDVAAPGVDVLSSIPKEPALGAVVGSSLNGKNSVVQGFSNHILNTDSDKKTFFTKVLSYMKVAKTDSILIVQDDSSQDPTWESIDVSPSYDGIIKALGYTNATSWNVVKSGSPTLDTLQKYSTVIWYTGEGINFDFNSIFTLTDYIMGGGKLNLSGTFITALLDGSPLLEALNTDMLYYDESRSNATELNGVSGTTFDGTNLSFAPNNFVSYLKGVPMVSASTTLVKFNTESDYSKSYEYYSGTSMATPHVTGIAALLASKNITDPLSLKSIIMNSVTPVKSLDGLMFKPGIVNAAKALNTNPDDDIPGVALNTTQLQSGALNSSTDINDVYYIDLKAGDTFTVSLTGDAQSDFDLHLYSPSGRTVASSEGIVASSEGSNSSETITYTATQTKKYYINVYAYSGSGNYVLRYAKSSSADDLTIEDSSKDLFYTGPWSTLSNSTNYSGGTAKQLTSTGSVTYTGTMETFQWKGFKGPDQGIAKLYVDNEVYGQVDLYSKDYSYNQILTQFDLSYGVHTIKIEWTGIASAQGKKGSTNINIDSIYTKTVKTKPYAPANIVAMDMMLNEIDLFFQYSAQDDVTSFNVYRSNDGINYSPIGTIGIDEGFMDIYAYMDTNLPATGTYYYKVTAVTSTGIESAPSKAVSAKATVTCNNYTLDNTSPYVQYTGAWTKESDEKYDNGSRHTTLTAGDKITIPYTGYGNLIKTYAGPDMGVIRIFTETDFGASEFVADLNIPFESDASFGSGSSERETGTITIECISGKITFDSVTIYDDVITNPAAPTNLTGTAKDGKIDLSWTLGASPDTKGYNIYRSSNSTSGYTLINPSPVAGLSFTDSNPLPGNNYYLVKAVNNKDYESLPSKVVRVANLSTLKAGTYQDSATELLYTGTWDSKSSNNYDGGTIKSSSSTANTFIEFKFTGTAFEWYGAKANSYGIAKIQIDGKEVATVDTYSSTDAYKQLLYKSAASASGTHTVKIIVTGTKNNSSKGNSVTLDKVIIK